MSRRWLCLDPGAALAGPGTGEVLLAQAQAAPWAGDVPGPRASSSGTARAAPRQGPAGPSPPAGSPQDFGAGRKLRAQQCGLESWLIWGFISFLPAVLRAGRSLSLPAGDREPGKGTAQAYLHVSLDRSQKPGLMGSTCAVRATSFCGGR